MTTEERVCEACGITVVRPKGESTKRFAERRFCSRECSKRAATGPQPVVTERSKVCQMCGTTFFQPENQRGKLWEARVYCSVACVHKARSAKAYAARPERTCPICGEAFRSSQPIARVTTCGKATCKRRYRHEIAAPKQAEKMRAAYASGTRLPASGISARELALWPSLQEDGWSWRMRWFDAWGCFELDFSLPDRKINVEIDGPEHTTGSRKQSDVARDAELERRGWRILRIPNADVDRSPEDVLALIAAFSRT